MMHAGFPLPDVDWEPTREFWAAAARHRLAIPRCDACQRLVWYPETPCRYCGGATLTWTEVSGRGRLFAWSVVRHAWIPHFADRVPLVTALIALEDDAAVRLVSLVVDCAPEALRCDMALRVDFRPLRFGGVAGEVVVPVFRPLEPRKT